MKLSLLLPALLLSLGALPLKYLLYLIQLEVYNIYRAARTVLVIAGLSIPFDIKELLYLDEMYRSLTEGGGERTLLRVPPKDQNYPHQKEDFFRDYHHLYYPTTPKENPDVEVLPLVFQYPQGSSIEFFIQSGPLSLPFNESDVEELLHSPSPDITLSLIRQRRSLGNATDFSTYLMKETVQGKLGRHDWDLDADRGYAWRNWAWGPDRPATGSPGTERIDAFYHKSPPF